MSVIINDDSVTISASTTSARQAYVQGNTSYIRVLNASSAVAFLRSGNSSVTATTSHAFLNAGKEAIFRKPPNDTHLAAILSTGTGNVYFMEVQDTDLSGF